MATIKDILNMPLEELEAMTDEQLLQRASVYQVHAELVVKTEEDDEEEKQPKLQLTGTINLEKPKRQKKPQDTKWLIEAARLMKEHNIVIDLPTTLQPKKK